MGSNDSVATPTPIPNTQDAASTNASTGATTAYTSPGQAIQTLLGANSWLYNIPELQPIFQSAYKSVKNSDGTTSIVPVMTQAQLMAQIEGTQWWKQNGGNLGQYEQLQQTNPEQLAEEQRNKQADIDTQAQSLGYNLSVKQIQDLAVNALKNNWDNQQLTEQLSAIATTSPAAQFNPNAPATSNIGTIDTAMQQMQQNAHSYGVKLSDQTAFQWAQEVAAGHKQSGDFTPIMQQWAEQMFPSLAGQIKQGVTTQQLLDPYKQAAASLLGKGAESIDIVNDPQWMKAFFSTDPTTGQQQLRSLTDAETQIRSDQSFGWQQTRNGQQTAAQMAQGIINEFGKTGASGAPSFTTSG